MAAVLDIIPLRSFVAVADCGGFHRAAATLHISQSAVSQHVRRLEKVLDRPLVARDGRRGRFTQAGEALLTEARRILEAHDETLRRLGAEEEDVIVVGSSEHAADQLLPEIATALRAHFPRRQIRFRLDRSGALAQAIEQGVIDVAIVLSSSRDVRADEPGIFAGLLLLDWYAAPSWVPPSAGDPVPLVAFDDPCMLRRRALDSLAGVGREATVVGEAAYLAGILAATRAGLGVAVLGTAGGRPEGLVRNHDLPPLEPTALRVRAREGAVPELAAITADVVRHVLSAPQVGAASQVA